MRLQYLAETIEHRSEKEVHEAGTIRMHIFIARHYGLIQSGFHAHLIILIFEPAQTRYSLEESKVRERLLRQNAEYRAMSLFSS